MDNKDTKESINFSNAETGPILKNINPLKVNDASITCIKLN